MFADTIGEASLSLPDLNTNTQAMCPIYFCHMLGTDMRDPTASRSLLPSYFRLSEFSRNVPQLEGTRICGVGTPCESCDVT